MRGHGRAHTIRVGTEVFQIHLGAPGRPRVYRVANGVQRRVSDNDPILQDVAVAFREAVEQSKLARELAGVRVAKERARRKRLLPRFFRRLGALIARTFHILLAAAGYDPEAWRGPR
jgi:hypothetical protein